VNLVLSISSDKVKLNLIQIFFINRRLTILLLLTCFVMMLFNAMYNFDDIKIYGHLFTQDETAIFMAAVDQVQIELKLVLTNLENNNVSLAQNHAYKSVPLTSKVISEIAEDNQGLAADLVRALNELQNISTSSKNNQQEVRQLVTDLDKRLEEAKSIRIAQVQPSSNFLDRATEFLGQIFGASNDEASSTQIENSRTEDALALAELIDAVLINYGKAYSVGFDMTNMSNMVMIGSNDSASSMMMDNIVTGNNADTPTMNMNMNMKTHSINTSDASVSKHQGEMNGPYSLANITDYQTAQALATKALQFFNSDLANQESDNNTVFITNLENGLTRLIDSIANKASPLNVMMIAHSEIHPNLFGAFNLELRE
jgi:hypothetical protein